MTFNNYPDPNFSHNNNFTQKRKWDINNETLLKEIISFSKRTKLWYEINMDGWKKKGLNDARLESNILEENVFFDNILDDSKGNTLFDEFGPLKVRLNQNLIGILNVTSFSQVLIMELGNVKNKKQLKKISPKTFSKELYVKSIEKLEFNLRIQIIDYYLKGDFNSNIYNKQKCIFDTNVVDFDQFYNSNEQKSHKEKLEKQWDDFHQN